MTDYNKWDKFCAEISSDEENVDFTNFAEQVKTEPAYDAFKSFNLTTKQRKLVEALYEELLRGTEFCEPAPDSELFVNPYDSGDLSDKIKAAEAKKTEFIDDSVPNLQQKIDDCVNADISPDVICQLVLDHDSVRFYDILAPQCFQYLYDKYQVAASIKGPQSELNMAHMAAFWAADMFLHVLVSIDDIDVNAQDKDGFTVAHYLVERCGRFWDPDVFEHVISTPNMLVSHGLNLSLTDHRGLTALEVLNMYISKGQYNLDGSSDAPEDIFTLRNTLKELANPKSKSRGKVPVKYLAKPKPQKKAKCEPRITPAEGTINIEPEPDIIKEQEIEHEPPPALVKADISEKGPSDTIEEKSPAKRPTRSKLGIWDRYGSSSRNKETDV